MRRHVLIAYTGGTIGMTRRDGGWGPDPGFLASFLSDMPELNAEAMPTFDVVEFDPLLDSSNMTPADWIRIAGALDARWFDGYDACVVLHGTDTMAYTASALAMILEDLDKPVILTGSQIPLCKPRNDGREHLVTALQIAGDPRAPREVCIYFGDRLLRGCRATKIDSSGFVAFDSPNLPSLARIGVQIDFRVEFHPVHFRAVRTPGLDIASPATVSGDAVEGRPERRPPGWRITSRFRGLDRPGVGEGEGLGELEPDRLARVGLLKLFPGMPSEWLEHVAAGGLDGLVLEGFGVGNGPDRDVGFMRALRRASERCVVVAVSQCLRGRVNLDDYVTGTALKRAGVIGGEDMTAEAALAKLFYLFQAGRTPDEVRRAVAVDLRGELTPVEPLSPPPAG